MHDPGSSAGAAISKLIEDALLEERARKASIEQRGLSVITSSGVLVTLLFALVALITKSTSFAPPAGSSVASGAAAVLFLAAAGLGLYCNFPQQYEEPDIADLESRVTDSAWSSDRGEAERKAAIVRVDVIKSAQKINDLKAKALICAISLEVLAVLAVVAVTFLVLLSPSTAASSGNTSGSGNPSNNATHVPSNSTVVPSAPPLTPGG